MQRSGKLICLTFLLLQGRLRLHKYDNSTAQFVADIEEVLAHQLQHATAHKDVKKFKGMVPRPCIAWAWVDGSLGRHRGAVEAVLC